MLFRSGTQDALLPDFREELGSDDGSPSVTVAVMRGHLSLQRGVWTEERSGGEALSRSALRREMEAEESKGGGGAGARGGGEQESREKKMEAEAAYLRAEAASSAPAMIPRSGPRGEQPPDVLGGYGHKRSHYLRQKWQPAQKIPGQNPKRRGQPGSGVSDRQDG